ncbi:MAG TPA: hypothetical protein VF538_08525 [Pyrinomonadaceae bacterium]|jgi:hypothetical protein
MEKDNPPQAKSGDTDWFLPSLLTTARKAGQRPAVTLSVGGLLIAGELIAAQEYFEELAGQTAGNAPPGSPGAGAAAQLEALFRRFAAAASKAEEVDEHSAHAQPYFIHLRSARVYHPGGDPIPAQGGMMWRVRLGAVDGFTLGLPHATQPL